MSLSQPVIDLRSDTVTHPTPAMRQAMANAVVGDDQYGEDPTVNRLEARAAEMVGKESAVYVSSGTMGNLVALLAHCGRGDEVILGDESHIFWYESGGAAALGGLPFNLRHTGRDGCLDLDDVKAAIRPPRAGYPRTGVICIENTQNRCGGVVLSHDYMAALASIADAGGVPVHMDGARIFNAAAALGIPAPELTRHVDSVQFCLSKGLAAPVGSVVAGDSEFIEKVRRQRKIVGGAMRQAGVIAAAGLIALEQMVDRLPEDHRRARRIAEGLAAIPDLAINLDSVQTNIIIFRPPVDLSADQVIERFADRGIRISNYGTRGLRMVTHYEIDDDAVAMTLEAAHDVMAATAVA